RPIQKFCMNRSLRMLPLVCIWPNSIRPGFKPRRTLQKRQLDRSRRAITLLPDDQFSHTIEFRIVGLVNLFAKDKRHYVGVLLNRSGFAKVGQLGAMVASATAFRGAA